MAQDNTAPKQEDFTVFMDSLVNDAVKQMDAMSRLELIKYAAETRVHLMHIYGLLISTGNGIKDMQQKQLLIIDTINDMIAGKPVKCIDDKDLKALNEILAMIEKESKRFAKS